ncbi:MAG TPA: hypoxanthine phosphoribosyltransferase [Stellaceae bacterium]|nr:hypoxanthine phosphoribosyltransferase [Stellaceae bacterium]
MPEPGDRLKLAISARRIRARVAALAHHVDDGYRGSNLTLVVVLKGAAIFAADLMRQITIPFAIDYIGAASYGAAMRSSGRVALSGIEALDVAGRDVLVIEDILDSGRTAVAVLDALGERRPASLALLPLLRKPASVRPELPVPHVGFDIGDEFVVGYGMDVAERYRNLPAIYRLCR